jgi:hypothetical protein
MHPELEICSTEMTLSVSRDNGRFEWSGKNAFTFFCQPSRLLDRNHWRLLYDVFRFNACARKLIIGQDPSQLQKLSIGEYLIREGYSDVFRDNYLIVSLVIYVKGRSRPLIVISLIAHDRCNLEHTARYLHDGFPSANTCMFRSIATALTHTYSSPRRSASYQIIISSK